MTRFSRVALRAAIAMAAVACAPHEDAAPGTPPVAAAPASPTTLAAADAARPNRVLDPAQFTDPRTRAAYAAARDNAAVLEHIYCYCHCHEHMGHRALIECFETDHGAGCDICQMEATVAAKMAAEGHSAAEIQKAIDAYYQA